MTCFVASCSSERSDQLSISLKIYPSGGGDCGYSITAKNDSLRATKCKVDIQDERILLTDTLDSRSAKLSTSQATKLLKEVAVLRAHSYPSKYDEFALDTWMFVLSIDGRENATVQLGIDPDPAN